MPTDPSRVEVALIPTTANRDVDILFVIDDSPAFLDTQTGFRDAFAAFMQELDALDGGRPNLHIGVVTSDVGTLGADDTAPGPSIGDGPGSCSGTGKSGKLQNNGTTLVNGVLITDIKSTDGTRITNYSGSITDAFQALAAVGSSGCGFEQHLHAARLALADDPANAGFLRADATLAIFVLTDEDDCSFMHSTFLGPEDDALGPLQSFRCTRFGITCDEGGATSDEMNQPGMKAACHANESSQYLMQLADYASFFKSLKTDARDLLFGVVSGDSAPFEVELRTPPGGGTPIPALNNVCVGRDANNPSVRLPELTTMFRRGVRESVCTTDLAPVQASFARAVRNLIGDSCLPRAVTDTSRCVVIEQRADGSESELSTCPASGDCYELAEDASCTASQLRVITQRNAAPPADTMLSVRCVQ